MGMGQEGGAELLEGDFAVCNWDWLGRGLLARYL